MARKAIRDISVTIGSVTGLGLASAPQWSGGSSVEGDKIAAMGDSGYTTVPRPVKSYPEATFTFLDEGDGKATAVEALVGTVVSVVLTSNYGDGKATPTTQTATLDMAILSCEPGNDVAVDGDRKATFVVKAVRHAPAAAAAAAEAAAEAAQSDSGGNGGTGGTGGTGN